MEKLSNVFYKINNDEYKDLFDKIIAHREDLYNFSTNIGEELIEKMIGELLSDSIEHIQELSIEDFCMIKGEIVFARNFLTWIKENKSGKVEARDIE